MNNPKIVVVMPAYNAEKTIEQTYKDIPKGIIDEVIVVDDGSIDNTAKIAKRLGLRVIKHERNMGYGANQKTCYKEAIKRNADIVVMIHPDYQYDSSLTGELIRPIASGRFDIMFGSRIRTRKEALSGGMPYLKYFLNRMTTLIENMVLGVNFTEHFSGFRAYSVKVLKTLPIDKFSNDYVFDQQLMVSAVTYGFSIAEYPVPVRYFSKSSSIQNLKGIKFLMETFWVLALYLLYKLRLFKYVYFK